MRVVETGSFRKAARQSGICVNTMRARIARLEGLLGTTLIVRTRQGAEPTPQGRAALHAIGNMDKSANGLPFNQGNQSLKRKDELRIFCPDPVVELWLLSHLGALRDTLQHIVISVHSHHRSHASAGDYDLTLSFDRPANSEAISAVIGSLHFMMFASEAYLLRFGHPRSVNGLAGHHFILMDSPEPEHNIVQQYAGEDVMTSLRIAKVGNGAALYEAVVRDLGIGMLPTLAAALAPSLRAVGPPLEHHLHLYLSFERPYRHSEPVDIARQWVRNALSGKNYPWFAERFVHPDEFGLPGQSQEMVPAAGIEPAAP